MVFTPAVVAVSVPPGNGRAVPSVRDVRGMSVIEARSTGSIHALDENEKEDEEEEEKEEKEETFLAILGPFVFLLVRRRRRRVLRILPGQTVTRRRCREFSSTLPVRKSFIIAHALRSRDFIRFYYKLRHNSKKNHHRHQKGRDFRKSKIFPEEKSTFSTDRKCYVSFENFQVVFL